MADLTITDTKATGGGCGCGCGHEQSEQQEQPQASGAVVANYTVTGMTCSHCTSAVTEEVSAIPGVTGVEVDLDSGALTVTSDAPVDFDRIVEAVAEAGDYTVS
ncbi:MAG: heavy metal-associated domain-containing protein [Propioniciclava sp.]|uniref:heavy-metal-associated domain-containing protein n=1 Tax=Propioniciclava sp. TaxID=2038686 RepID=UPI0039E33B5B